MEMIYIIKSEMVLTWNWSECYSHKRSQCSCKVTINLPVLSLALTFHTVAVVSPIVQYAAACAIQTWIVDISTWVIHDVTVLPSVTRGTHTCVVIADVHTCSTAVTWVICGL